MKVGPLKTSPAVAGVCNSLVLVKGWTCVQIPLTRNLTARDVFASFALHGFLQDRAGGSVCGGGTIGDVKHIRLYLTLIRDTDHGSLQARIGSSNMVGEDCFFSMRVEPKREADLRKLQRALYHHCRETQSLNGTDPVLFVLLDSSQLILTICEVLPVLFSLWGKEIYA